MGLWLKCPGCQGKNPLFFTICSQCGQSLENLPPEQRVYVVEPGGPPSLKPAAPARAAVAEKPAVPPGPPPVAAPPAEKKPKRPKRRRAES